MAAGDQDEFIDEFRPAPLSRRNFSSQVLRLAIRTIPVFLAIMVGQIIGAHL